MKPVISTCCFVFQQIKETGGLKKLVALITDQPPPDDEPKGAKGGEKKAGSRAAKKSAKGDCEYFFLHVYHVMRLQWYTVLQIRRGHRDSLGMIFHISP